MATSSTIARFIAKPSSTANTGAGRSWLLVTFGMLAVDTCALGIAFSLAYLLRFKTGLPFLVTPPHQLAFYSSIAFWAVPAWLGLFALYRLYDRQKLFTGFQEYICVVNACTASMMATILFSFLDKTLQVSRGWLVLVWVMSIVVVSSSRFAVRRLLRRLRSKGILTARTVIVGANEEGLALAEQLMANPATGIHVVGFIDNAFQTGVRVSGPLPILGSLRDLPEIVASKEIREVIVATTAVPRDELLYLYQSFGYLDGVELRLSSGLFEILTTGVSVQEIAFVPLMTPQRVRITGVDAALKAVVDYASAALALIVLFPTLLVIALLIKWDSPGPVLYRRRVLGRSGKPFDAFKFRTMVVDAAEVLANNPQLQEEFNHGVKLRVDPRVTKVGRWLRRSSLDELPQLVNVLRSEMSLVGPRMISPEEAFRYGKWQLNLLTVKPGLTGPWQVRGRSDVPYEERVRLSMNYIRNYTIWSDLEILLRTIPAVLQSQGAY